MSKNKLMSYSFFVLNEFVDFFQYVQMFSEVSYISENIIKKMMLH